MKGTLIILLLLLTKYSVAQVQFRGSVKDAESGAGLNAVSVFISNSKIGTTTSPGGEFILNIPQGKYDIIISSIGYETQVLSIDEKPKEYNSIFLKQKPKALEEVQLTAFEKDGWLKWGKFFTDYFIGTMPNAQDCKLKNNDKVRFRMDKINNTLSAIAYEPLVVENTALGYILQYQLEDFTYNFKKQIFYYEGYPLFIEMKGSEKKKERWEKKREEVYYGSMLHFMRALFRNQLIQEGFEVRRLIKKENTEKERVKKEMALRISEGSKTIINIGGNDDSTAYYSRILKQPDNIDILYKPLLPGDSIAYAIDSATAGLYFKYYLDINYSKAKAPHVYASNYNLGTDQVSQITLTKDIQIAVWENGSYHPSRNILSSGYWAWSEKAGNMLPMDYWPKDSVKK